jgi:diadenosine tetraphosphate (Ap4A) HIT family hydrolase
MSSPPRAFDENCVFCKIVRADDGFRVFEDEHTLAFLDHRPLFPGHCLLIPKSHLETINDLPDSLLSSLSVNVRMLSAAVELGIARKARSSLRTIALAKAFRTSTCTSSREPRATA